MWHVIAFVVGLVAGTIWGRRAWDAAGDWVHAKLWGE